MSKDNTIASARADQLRSRETQLTQAKDFLREYQSIYFVNWQTEETAFINKAIDSALFDINAAINQLSPMSDHEKTIAMQKKRSDEAAEKARKRDEETVKRTSEQLRANQIRSDLEAAKANSNNQKRKLDSLIKAMGDQASIMLAYNAYSASLQRVDELQKAVSNLAK